MGKEELGPSAAQGRATPSRIGNPATGLQNITRATCPTNSRKREVFKQFERLYIARGQLSVQIQKTMDLRETEWVLS